MTEIDHTTFENEVLTAGETLSPARANLLLAREVAYPDLRPSDYLVQLDDLALAARAALQPHSGRLARGLALADYLFGELQFRGNTADYSDPRNSFLNEVLDRRLGIPISLSVVYTEVAGRLRLPVAGVGLPGHFIAAVEAEDQVVYVDAFNGGRRLSLDDCRDLVHAATGIQGVLDLDWLAPTPPRAIVARMLTNLRVFYLSVEDWPLAARVVERLRLVQPEVVGHVRDLGVLYYRAGAYRQATRCLDEYVTLAPDAPDADSVRQGRDLLQQELARLN